LTEFDTLTVPTRTNGSLEVWREVEGNAFSVYAARGTTAAGETRTGFGISSDEAVISVLHELAAKDASDAPSPDLPEIARLRNAVKAKHFADMFGGPPPLRPLADFEVQGSVTGRLNVRHPDLQPFPTHAGSSRMTTQPPALPELPEEFYRALGKDQKILAIKEARNAFNWPLVDAKRFTDWVFSAHRRIRAEELAASAQLDKIRAGEFQADRAPIGTVIRIKGKPGGPLRSGWLLEKTHRSGWHTTALLDTYPDDAVQESVRHHGCILIEEAK
jgi:hypothetical protein